MTDVENDTQPEAGEAAPDGILIYLASDGKPGFATVGEGLPDYSAPLMLRKVANVLEDNLLR